MQKFNHITVHPDIWADMIPFFKDLDLVNEHTVSVSPTLIFNERQQRLNGNVGYRVIEANTRELLDNPTSEQSRC